MNIIPNSNLPCWTRSQQWNHSYCLPGTYPILPTPPTTKEAFPVARNRPGDCIADKHQVWRVDEFLCFLRSCASTASNQTGLHHTRHEANMSWRIWKNEMQVRFEIKNTLWDDRNEPKGMQTSEPLYMIQFYCIPGIRQKRLHHPILPWIARPAWPLSNASVFGWSHLQVSGFFYKKSLFFGCPLPCNLSSTCCD